MRQESKYKAVVNAHRYRAIKLGLTEHFTVSEWVELLNRTNFTCMACGNTVNEAIITADHVVPLARGGKNTIDNIQVLCRSCNSKKHAKTVDYRSETTVHLNRSPRTLFCSTQEQKYNRESRYALRLPPELYVAIKEAAAQSNQSMNEYIVMALTQFMSVKDAHEKRIADLEIRVADLIKVVGATALDPLTLAATGTVGKPSE